MGVLIVRAQSVSYDQSDYPTILNFHLNGHDAPFKSITSVRGDMRPAISGKVASPAQWHSITILISISLRSSGAHIASRSYRGRTAVSDEATLELVFDEDFFGQAPPHNFFPLMHGAHSRIESTD